MLEIPTRCACHIRHRTSYRGSLRVSAFLITNMMIAVASHVFEQNAKRSFRIADREYVLKMWRGRFEGPGGEFLDNEDVLRLYLGG